MNMVRAVQCAVTVAVGPVVGLCMVGFVAGVSVAWVPVVRESAQLVCL